MIPLRFEQASVVCRQLAPISQHRLSPRAFFLATRNISWGRTSSPRVRANSGRIDVAANPSPDHVTKVPGRRRPVPLRKTPRTVRTAVPAVIPDAAPEDVEHESDEANEDIEIQESDEANQNVEISLFEQDEGNESSRQEVDISKTDELDKELEEREKELDDRIRAMEEDINQTGFPEISEDFAKELFTEDEKDDLIKSIGQNWDDFQELPHHVEEWKGLSDTALTLLENFNGALNQASINTESDKAGIELWRWYARCKIYLKGFITRIPDEAWELLWLSQSEDSPSNPNRASHLRILAEDMVKAGITLTPEQRYSQLEGMFLDGQREKALAEWEKGLQSGDGTSSEFLELGVSMYAASGNVERTLELYNLLLAVKTTWNLEPFINTLLVFFREKSEPSTRQQAIDLYRKVQQRFSSSLKMEDYDTISLALLKSGDRDFALMVFRDLMLTGDAASKKNPSFIRQIQDRVGELIQPGQSGNKVNKFMLENMKYLPRQYQNKYFFAKWLRKLVSMGEVDAAAMVVELMYERGISPDPLHINGLIGAWLRFDTPETRRQAEEMGWAMIQTRLALVASRRSERHAKKTNSRSVRDGVENAVRIPTWIARPTPPATIETFCIMVKYYLHSEAFDTVRHLRNLLTYAEIPMNSVFMNHLLYAELHYRSYSAVWARFEVMSRTVIADVETWICLWEGEKQEIISLGNPHADLNNENITRFPKPRQLFASMTSWTKRLHGRHLRDALDDMEIDTYNDVVRCFCLSRDLVGAFLAMREMTTRFKIYPDPTTVRMLLLQISKMSTVRNRPGRRITTPGKADAEEKMSKTTEVLGLITQHRRDLLQQRGVDFEKNLSEVQQAEETLRTLLQLLFTISKRLSKGPSVFQVQLDSAAKAMGVEAMDADKTMALIV